MSQANRVLIVFITLTLDFKHAVRSALVQYLDPWLVSLELLLMHSASFLVAVPYLKKLKWYLLLSDMMYLISHANQARNT